MSMLRSAVDEIRSHDLRFASDEELGEDLRELERVSRVVESERARRLAEVDRRSAWAVDGHLSIVSWVAAQLRAGFGRATQQVKLARALKEMPVTSAAFGAGDLSSEAVWLLVQTREAAPEAFEDSEEMLVGAAGALSAREFRHALAYWREAADPVRAEERARRVYESRHLHVSLTFAGTVRIDGDLDPESGQTLITALRSVQDAWCRKGMEDARTAPQRRADALAELSRAWLDSSVRPEVAGERPHVVVSVDLETLQGRLGQVCEFDETGPVTAEAARRLACDASVSRVITRGASEPLDVGTRTPVVPSGMRRALVVRDRGCRFPGCGRPQAWCDSHHVKHWADGGDTALRNLVLLCRPHHRAVHEDFRVMVLDGRPVFARMDGTVLEDRAPPQRWAAS